MMDYWGTLFLHVVTNGKNQDKQNNIFKLFPFVEVIV